MKEKILVTGANGFIGSHTVAALVKIGYQVGCVDIATPASAKYYFERRQKWKDDVAFEEFLSITRPSFERKLVEFSPDVVINLAAIPGVRASVANPGASTLVNCYAVAQLLRSMELAGCDRLIQASTSSVYGSKMPPFSEDVVGNSLSPYAAAKRGAELLIDSWCHNKPDFKAISLRYFTVYGSWGRPDMLVDRLINAAMFGGEVGINGNGDELSRSFTHVTDVVHANLKAVEKILPIASKWKNEKINIGSGHTETVEGMIQTVERISRRPIKRIKKSPVASDMVATEPVLRKAKLLLDWEPGISIDAGIDLTWTCHQKTFEQTAVEA